MIQLKETLESAWTPELGGKFGDMKLLVKADLPVTRRKRSTQYMKNDVLGVKMDAAQFVRDYDDTVLDLIVGWENVGDGEGKPLPFSPEAAKRLINFADEETGHEIEVGTPEEPKKRPALLFEYVYRFAGDTRNFLKN